MNQPHGLPSKYAPLNAYLVALPAEQASVTLTFTELEALLGAALPASVWTTAFWATDALAKHNWQQQGWYGVLNRPARGVTFTRRHAPPPPRQPIDREAVLAGYRQGMTIAALAHQFSVTTSAIHQLLMRAGVARRPRRTRRTAALSTAYRTGETLGALATQFGVSRETAARALRVAGDTQRPRKPRRSDSARTPTAGDG